MGLRRERTNEPGVPDLRVDPLSGAPVVVIGSRQERPNLPRKGCPFCPGGLEAPEPYDVRWFENRWPAMEGGRCEIVLYTPVHDASFASLGVAGAGRVVELWTERTAELSARPDIDCVLIFENRGAEVGATIPHPHGQIYAFGWVPPAVAAELQGPCALCRERPGPRLVSEVAGWRAWVPHAASWPYELLLAPDDHVPDLPSAGHDGLAALLVDVLGRLDRLFDAPMPYTLWIHQRPSDGGDWPYAHLHVHIAPLYRAPHTPRFVAAGELGSGVFFNPLPPEDAAQDLRDA